MSTEVPVRLALGKPVLSPLKGGETQSYLVHMEPGEYLRATADQRGIDLVLRLYAPGAKEPLTEVDSPIGAWGPERVSEVSSVAGDFRLEVSAASGLAPGNYEMRIDELRPATDLDRRRVEGERLFAEGEGLRRAKKTADALARYEQALAIARETKDRAAEAASLYRFAWIDFDLEQWQKAIEFCDQALVIYRQLDDKTGEGMVLNRRGRALLLVGRYAEAEASHGEAARVFHDAGSAIGEIDALANLGTTFKLTGRVQRAIEAYNQALTLCRRLGDRSRELTIQFNLATLYVAQDQRAAARDALESAVSTAKALSDNGHLAVALGELGELDQREGRLPEAREHLGTAIELSRALRDRRTEAIGLNSLGTTLLKQGDFSGSEARFAEARGIFHALGDLQGEATVLVGLGRLAQTRGDARKALAQHQAALALSTRLGDRAGVAVAHYGSAQALVSLGDLAGARDQLEASVSSVESLREESQSLGLRTSYFASKQHYLELYVDVLMQLDVREPNRGHAARALEAAERRRSRSLLDALAETRAEIRKGVAPELVRQEREVQQLLDQTERTRLVSADAKRSEALDRQVRELLGRLEQVRARMRSESPRFAELVQPKTLSAAEIQQHIPDSNTLLLIYSLGDERSYLFRVSRQSLTGYTLAGRGKIEAAARQYRELVAHGPRPAGASPLRRQTAADLAAMILDPVAAELPRFRRLLIVADGALQRIPFAALPDPASSPTPAGERPPLVVQHEIVGLPSASVLAILQQERAAHRTGRLQAGGPLIAVVADPVFAATDPRVHGAGAAPQGADGDLARAARDLGLLDLARLPYTRHEADAILRLLKPGESLAAFDFDASRELVTSGRLRPFRVVHFATHSLADDQHPELSGLVLSLVGEDSRPRDGFLRLHEIYDLDLTADLVVLSACETGVGQEIRGEGMFALTRGFMYAGVPQVVVTLWKVADQATAELMARFYDNLLEKGLPAAQALQKAQVSMLADPAWSDPYYWAGFVAQGDFQAKLGGGVEAAETGGMSNANQAGTDLPPPKVAPPHKPGGSSPPAGACVLK